VSKVIVHERFNLDNMLNSDISLLKIDGPIKINRLVRPACLPSQTYMEPKSNNLMVVGWGTMKWGDRNMPIYLQEVKLSIVEMNDCAKKYSIKKYTIYRSQFCTWNDKQDACQVFENRFEKSFFITLNKIQFSLSCNKRQILF
jgi:secreted trypsin-like serine protease